MDSEIKNEISKLDKNVRIILIIGAIAIISLPIITTQFSWLFDFSNTGEIGDTLSGTTAPVIGIVSALLIYFSFRAQIRANEIIQIQFNQQKLDQKEDKEFEFQMERYKHLKELIDEFKTTIVSGVETHLTVDSKNKYLVGVEGIHYFFLKNKRYNMEATIELSQLYAIISNFTLILNNLEPVKSNSNHQFIFNLIEIQFYRRIWDQNSHFINQLRNTQLNFSSEIIDVSIKLNEIHIELVKYKEIWP